MTRPAALALAALAAAATPAAADMVNWTAPAAFVNKPSTTGTGLLTVDGVPGRGRPTVQDLPKGFTYTNVRLTYVFGAGDFDANDKPNVVHIRWSISRDFDGVPAGKWYNTSQFDGSAVIQPGSTVSFDLTETTTHVKEGAGSAAVATVNINLNSNSDPDRGAHFQKKATKFFAHGGQADSLLQEVDIAMKGVKVGDEIRFFFPDSVTSLTSPVVIPEPSAAAMLGVGAAGLLGWARRRRATA